MCIVPNNLKTKVVNALRGWVSLLTIPIDTMTAIDSARYAVQATEAVCC